MKCRNCGRDGMVKSKLKGVCKHCFPTMTPRAYQILNRQMSDVPRAWLKGIKSDRPPVSQEMAEKERAQRMKPGGGPRKLEIELESGDAGLLAKIRFANVRKAAIAGPSNVESMLPSVPEKMVTVELSDEDLKLLEQAKIDVKFGIRDSRLQREMGRSPKVSKHGRRGH